ncbi:MAG: MBL fold metallo-hydrolase [Burkholderiales bacterium]|nr:MBL fold metallo-hydrolase [Burkholderiales bacterium]
MRFACLGSGSEGNALVVEVGVSRVLLDCGFSIKETVTRLARLELEPTDLNGIVVTHEHSDHIGGVTRFANKFNLPVWLTHGSLAYLSNLDQMPLDTRVVDSHAAFAVGDLYIEPFPVPHDAREPIQFVFGDGQHRLGVLTDTGMITPHIEQMLSGCNALVLECNHDAGMLANGPYPNSLKQRVGGRFGHLDNHAAAALLRSIDTQHLTHLVAAHLSQKNNMPELARAALAEALNCAEEWIGIADQALGFDWRTV